jgi:hypothetical protein
VRLPSGVTAKEKKEPAGPHALNTIQAGKGTQMLAPAYIEKASKMAFLKTPFAYFI